MKIREVNLLFPEIVFTKILDQISDDELIELNNNIRNLDFHTTAKIKTRKHLSASSNNLYVFELPEFKKLADVIKKEFNDFKNNTLKYTYNDFVYTTSWATKAEPGQESDYHNHANCMYSGIIYTNVEKDSGNLLLTDMTKSGFCLKVSEQLDYNSASIHITPINKMVIFFPSNLHHKIEFNNSNITRHSIAFNFMPIGKLGYHDSQLILGK